MCGIAQEDRDLARTQRYQKGEEEPRASFEKRKVILICPRHAGIVLKYFCTNCSKLVCSECLVEDHGDHQYSKVNEVRHRLETKMKEFEISAVKKKEEFSEYLKKVQEAESKALECSECIKLKVNSMFDGIVALVNTQRNEALQRALLGVKKIWSQEDMAKITLAKIDSFTRFSDRSHRCTNDASYVAMAIQGIKLMEQLKDTHADEGALDHKKEYIWSGISEGISLDNLLQMGKPSLKFTPAPGTIEIGSIFQLCIEVAVMVEDLPIISQKLRESCKLDVKYMYAGTNNELTPKVEELAQSHELCWTITIDNEDIIKRQYPELVIQCALTGDLVIETQKVIYKTCACK